MFSSKDVVVVTGSSRGLGAAIARAFHAQGARVVVNYFQNEAAARRVSEDCPGSLVFQADVQDAAQVESMFTAAKHHFGQSVSVVVNSALVDFRFNGDERDKLHESLAWSNFDQQIQGSLRAAFNTTKAAYAYFQQTGRGSIINIGSNLVANPVVPYHDYTAAKGALLAFTRTTAVEYGPSNITCNMVSAGLLETTDASAATPGPVFDQIKAVTPMRKVCKPEDVCGAVLFLASTGARMITGQQLIVDGGLVMH